MELFDVKDKIKCLNIVIGCSVGCPYCYARTTARRFSMTEDFSKPLFREHLLKRFDTKTPNNYLVTGMSDPSDWQPEWLAAVLEKMAQNPQHEYLFLTKRPDKIRLTCDLPNVWFGVTVTRQSELWRMQALRENVRGVHYHVTFEPLFERIEGIDFSGFEWTVVGTETGRRKGKVDADPAWVMHILEQADEQHVPAFMKVELARRMPEEYVRQQLPAAFLNGKGGRGR